MAGLGSAWGSREEFLHPRDRHGRFRKKWQMAENVINAISNFLDNFNPRTFQSDGQSGQYLFNRAKPSRFGGGALYPRLHADYDEANANLRAGNMDKSTKKFVKMMDDSAINLDSDVILSRTVGPDAFGLTPEQMNLEDGGIEDFTGRLIADRGYSAANIGTPMSHGPGKITMSIAVPKGTKAIIPARSAGDRGIFLDRDQELRITKVKPDGTGGYYMLAVATPRTPGNTPEPINRSPRGLGLNPKEREARVLGIQNAQAKREGIISDAQINAAEIDKGTQQGVREQPAQLPPAQGAPTAPGGPEPRNEPILKESIGGPSTTGKGTAEIAQTPPPEAPSAPEAPVAPRNFRDAVKEADIPVPSPGKRRVQWNRAYGTLTAGRRDPGDVLRELESDIDVFRHLEADNQRTGHEDPHLAGDIGSLNKLADLISKEYGVQRRNRIPAAPRRESSNLERGSADLQKRIESGQVKVTPIAQAPGEKHRQIPGEAGTRKVTNLEAKRAAKAVQAPRAPQREEPTPPPVPKKAPELAKVLPIKKTATPEATQFPETTPGSGKVRMSQLSKGVPILVEKRADGTWVPATKKTGATRITVKEVNPVTGRGGQRQVVGTDEQGNRVEVESRANVQTFFLGNAPTKKAVPSAPAVAKKALPRKGTLADAKREAALSAFFKNDMSAEDKAGGKFRFIRDLFSEGRISLPEARSGASDEAAHWRREQTRFIDAGDGAKADEAGRIASRYEKLASDLQTSQSVVATDKIRQAVKKAAPPEAQVGMANEISRMARLIDNRPDDPVDTRNAPKLKAIATRLEGGPITGTEQRELRDQLREIAKDYPNSTSGDNLDGWANALDKLRSQRAVPKFPSKTAPAAKKAAPSAPTPKPAAGPDIDKMTKAELLAYAKRPEIVARVRTFMTKDQIKQEIRRAQEIGPPEPGSQADRLRQAREDKLDVTVKELQIIADHEGVPRRGRPTNKAKLQETIRANRAERANAPAAEPNAPAAQKLIQAPDRREAFGEDWINTPAMAKINERTAAGRSILEVRDDVLKGKITPDEGIRRLENDIDLNKQDLAEMQQELRGDLPDDEREAVSAAVDKLRQGISDQENASSFMRKHFRQAPAVTPEEVKIHLDPEAKKLIDSAGPNDIREAAKIGGLGDLKGETKDELLKDLIRKTAARELEKRAAKKAVPKKLTPAPLVTKKSGDPDYVDARAIAEGLDMDESDSRMLGFLQEKLDGGGRFNEKPITPAAAGRLLEKWANGPSGPAYGSATLVGVNSDGLTPEQEKEHTRLQAQFDRWMKLADRLKNTRRRPARKATEPAPEKPKLTTEEKKVTAQAAEVLGVPKEQLQSRALAKKVAAAPPPEAAKSVVEQLGKMDSEEEGRVFLQRRTKAELADIARASNLQVQSKDSKQTLLDRIVGVNIGGRKSFEGVLKEGGAGGIQVKPASEQLSTQKLTPQAALDRLSNFDNPPSREEAHALLKDMSRAELVDIGKRISLPIGGKTKADLQREIVEGTAGRRLDSIAIRGFKESRIETPREIVTQGRDLNLMTPAELANLESELGIKRTSLDRGDRIAAIRAAQAESNTQASIPKSLPSSGHKWDWATIQEDGGTMHGDSASMNLAQKLRKAGREDAAQYVADMRYRISRSSGEHDAADVEKMVADLKKMRDAEPDPAIKKAYDRALEDIDAPQSPAPKLPASTPEPLKKMMNELNQIPVARRTGHFAGTSKSVSAVDRLAELIRQVEAGDAGSAGTVENEIRNILRSFHESVDGAYQMWRLESLIDSPDIRKWIRSFYPKT
jgi:hypothetical protein